MNRDPHQIDNPMILRERCLAYLLDEMTEYQSTAFEAEFGDPDVSAALVRESNLLCRVATSHSLDVNDTADSIHALPCPTPPCTTPRSVVNSRFITTLIAALAVTVLIASFSVFSSQDSTNSAATQIAMAPPSASFELELAKTWVQPAIQWVPDAPQELNDSASDDVFVSFDENESEESFEWMVAAVQASIPMEQHNDG